MAFLASEELDGVEEKRLFQAPRSPSSFQLPQAQTWLLGAIIRLWPLGLVLANAAVGERGFRRKLVVWACLQLPASSPGGCAVRTAQEQGGVTSIRALPQVRWDGGRPARGCPGSSPLTAESRRQGPGVPSGSRTEARTRAALTLLGNQSLSSPLAAATARTFPEPFRHLLKTASKYSSVAF